MRDIVFARDHLHVPLFFSFWHLCNKLFRNEVCLVDRVIQTGKYFLCTGMAVTSLAISSKPNSKHLNDFVLELLFA